MDGSIDTIFDGNVFHPVTPAPLSDGTKVTLTFEVLEDTSVSGEQRDLSLSAEERLRRYATADLHFALVSRGHSPARRQPKKLSRVAFKRFF